MFLKHKFIAEISICLFLNCACIRKPSDIFWLQKTAYYSVMQCHILILASHWLYCRMIGAHVSKMNLTWSLTNPIENSFGPCTVIYYFVCTGWTVSSKFTIIHNYIFNVQGSWHDILLVDYSMQFLCNFYTFILIETI